MPETSSVPPRAPRADKPRPEEDFRPTQKWRCVDPFFTPPDEDAGEVDVAFDDGSEDSALASAPSGFEDPFLDLGAEDDAEAIQQSGTQLASRTPRERTVQGPLGRRAS
jgi:hypothetical protein